MKLAIFKAVLFVLNFLAYTLGKKMKQEAWSYKSHCIIYCYSGEDRGLYVGMGWYNVGAMLVAGNYYAGYCYPNGYEGEDLTTVNYFTKICSKRFNCIDSPCWADGALVFYNDNESLPEDEIYSDEEEF